MTHQELEKYIDLLNSENSLDGIFTRIISKSVTKAKIWEKEPNPNIQSSCKVYYSTYYFIKNNDNKYIGVVLFTSNNVHWFVKEQHRKKGYLTKAMKKEILPNMFYEENEINLSIQKSEIFYEDSIKVAESLNFEKINETDYCLLKDNFCWKFESFREENKKINKKRREELENQINYHRAALMKIHDELEMAYGESEFKKIAEKLDSISIK